MCGFFGPGLLSLGRGRGRERERERERDYTCVYDGLGCRDLKNNYILPSYSIPPELRGDRQSSYFLWGDSFSPAT